MTNNKKTAAPEKGQAVSSSSNNIIPKKTQKVKHKKHKYVADSQVRTLSVKIYEEQLPLGLDDLKCKIESIDSSKMQVLGIVHDRDLSGNDIWLSSVEKLHIHIIVRMLNGERFRIRQLLDMLGIVFRPELDDSLWDNHGVETCKDFTAMSMYLTHETPASEEDGKELYLIEDIFSNLSVDEIKQIRDGYVRVSTEKTKITEGEYQMLDRDAFTLGYELKDFNDWYQLLPIAVRRSSNMKVIEKSYFYGITKKAEERDNLNRLCVYIEGGHNTGKTYTAKETLKKLGKKTLDVGGAGTGKFDRLSVSHQAIVIDDDVCPRLLQMSDNYICNAYRRNSNNGFWCGDVLVVTYNKDFDQWLEDCGIKSDKQKEAVKSRFYVCELRKRADGTNSLFCSSPSDRGSVQEQEIRKGKYLEFRNIFNDLIRGYRPTEAIVDYSDINEEEDVATYSDYLDWVQAIKDGNLVELKGV